MASIGFRSNRVMLLAGLSNICALPLSRPASNVAPPHVGEAQATNFSYRDSILCDARTLPVYVINLDARGAKLDTFTKRLPSPLKPCRVTGVNGSTLPDSLDPNLISSESWNSAKLASKIKLPILGTLLTRGAVGLALAHARAWAHMVERGDQVALIAEDDLHFYVPNLIEQIEGACEIARLSDPEQILLQFCGGNTTFGTWPKPQAGLFSRLNLTTDEQVMASRTGAKPDEAFLRAVFFEQCQGFYLLTNRGARIMLESLFPIAMQIDAGVQTHKVFPYIGPPSVPEELEEFSPITWSPYWGAARAPGLNTHGLFPPVAQCDDRDGHSDAQQGVNYVGPNTYTESSGATVEACGGVASLGTSDNAKLLLEYFVQRRGTWHR